MKKNIFLLMSGILFTLQYSIAAPGAGNEPEKAVVNSFKADFPIASKISWEQKQGIHIAKFQNNNRAQYAYYNEEGEFLGQVWAMTLTDLPGKIKTELLKGATEQDIKSIYLFLKSAGYPEYIVTAEKNGKRVTRKINSYGQSSTVKKQKVPVL